MFDEDSDCLDEIGLIAITSVESAPDSSGRNNDGHLFDIRCHVKKGGDSQGQKTFNFDAKTGDNALEWMRMICEATKSLVLVPKENGYPGYMSVVSEEHAIEVRKKSMMKMFQSFGVAGSPTAGPLGGGFAGGVGTSSDQSNTPGTSHTGSDIPPPTPFNRPNQLLQGGRGPNFRGGRGSGRGGPTVPSSPFSGN